MFVFIESEGATVPNSGEIHVLPFPDDMMVVGGNVFHAMEFVVGSDSRISMQGLLHAEVPTYSGAS